MIRFPLSRETRTPLVPFTQVTESYDFDPAEFATGIRTGEPSGIFVVDLDTKKGKDGIAALDAIGIVPETYTVQTRSGGVHLYFKHPGIPVPNSVSKLGPGIDVRGENGYVVAPPTDGYVVLDDRSPVDAPPWLLAKMGEPAKTIDLDTPRTVAASDAKIEEAKAWLETQAPCIEGQGGQKHLWTVCRALTLEYALAEDVALGIMAAWNATCVPPWEEHELVRTLQRAARSTWEKVPSWFDRLGPKPKDENGYSFQPGRDRAPSEKLVKITTGDAVFALTNDPAWQGVLCYDTFSRAVRAIDPPCPLQLEIRGLDDTDVTSIRIWFESQGFAIGFMDCKQAIKTAAMAKEVHPVREYLDSLPKGDPKYLDRAAERLFGATTDIENTFFRRMMIGAVARIYEPGTKFDTMLVLYGSQGIRKSSFVRDLFSPWYRSQMPELTGRDASHALEGYWGIELPELDKVQKLETETVKEFLSRQIDDYRQYGNGEKVRAFRQCVFVGTTNSDDFLRDQTGNRRYWIISVTKRIEALSDIVRNELWSAAKALYEAGEQAWLTDEEEMQANALRANFEQEDDPWGTMAWEKMKTLPERFKTSELLAKMFEGSPEKASKMDRRSAIRLASIIRKAGGRQIVSAGMRQWKNPTKRLEIV